MIWVTRSLAVEKWTAIREIGVVYDAALVVTTDRAKPQSTPSNDTFTIWNVSLTSHAVAPLLTGVNLRWFEWEHFASSAPEELTLLYDNCQQLCGEHLLYCLPLRSGAPHVGGALDCAAGRVPWCGTRFRPAAAALHGRRFLP